MQGGSLPLYQLSYVRKTCGGEGGIRTRVALEAPTAFQAAALNRSATSPFATATGPAACNSAADDGAASVYRAERFRPEGLPCSRARLSCLALHPEVRGIARMGHAPKQRCATGAQRLGSPLSRFCKRFGRGWWIRTTACRNQNPMPYRLAKPLTRTVQRRHFIRRVVAGAGEGTRTPGLDHGKVALYQAELHPQELAGQAGIEPATTRLTAARSTELSYWPKHGTR